mmetsp:Transcript_35512/g.91306  ORF Transcript_35512/g.91306 Transcript_35512/m.91306 type:complete len:209 (-) Transcript_35512:172-798(-)
MEDVEMAEPIVQTPKLEQSEAIMAAIINSKNPLPINPPEPTGVIPASLNRFVQQVSDRMVPWRRCRWIAFFIVLATFATQVALMERHFFIAYMIAIYLLNQVLLFISPATEDDELPMAPQGGELDRPFVRALSEYRLWERGILCTLGALVLTWFDAFDVDVDPRALVVYFVILFVYTMKQQIVHMIKYKYVPWSGSKKRVEKGDAFDV